MVKTMEAAVVRRCGRSLQVTQPPRSDAGSGQVLVHPCAGGDCHAVLAALEDGTIDGRVVLEMPA